MGDMRIDTWSNLWLICPRCMGASGLVVSDRGFRKSMEDHFGQHYDPRFWFCQCDPVCPLRDALPLTEIRNNPALLCEFEERHWKPVNAEPA
jgi:hypothetical protein